MQMTSRWRKVLLVTHVASAVGWFGALAVFIVLAVTGKVSSDAELVTACYLVMKLTVIFVIVPFCTLALVTGIVQALLTPWGLIRHYWVLLKLILTSIATFLLTVHITPVGDLADYARNGTLGAHSWMRTQLLAYACGALIIMTTSMTLAVFKPRGVTPWAPVPPVPARTGQAATAPGAATGPGA